MQLVGGEYTFKSVLECGVQKRYVYYVVFYTDNYEAYRKKETPLGNPTLGIQFDTLRRLGTKPAKYTECSSHQGKRYRAY